MHVVDEVRAPREFSAGKARFGDTCQEESGALPIAAEQIPQGSKTKEGLCNQKAVLDASSRGSRMVRLQACYRGASALPWQPSRHSHCRARRDRSTHTVPPVSAKGNNSRIKPCRFQSAAAAYTENFGLQIEAYIQHLKSVPVTHHNTNIFLTECRHIKITCGTAAKFNYCHIVIINN